MTDAFNLAIQYEANKSERIAAASTGLTDQWEVVTIDTDGVYARQVGSGGDGHLITVLKGVRVSLGDTVAMVKVWGRWVAIGSISGSAGAFTLLQSEPILIPPIIRDSTSLANGWSGTTDLSSLRHTVRDLDPGAVYLVRADAGMYLTSASASTRVAAGVRIGFASDTESVGEPQFGAGHRSTAPQWCRARFERIVSSVSELQVTGRAYASATGAHTIGDADLHISITPLATAGRI